MRTLARDVYEVIRQRVVSGKLAPGVRVSELALAKELGISRGPIREAMKELTGEGLLEMVPNAGSFVKQPDRRELEELFQLREWLEVGVVGEVAGRLNPTQLAELEQSCEEFRAAIEECRRAGRTTVPAAMEERIAVAEMRFHLTLLTACGNRPVLKIVANQHVVSQLLPRFEKDLIWEDEERTLAEHVAIFQAVRDGDASAAREVMRRHLRQGRELTLAAVDRQQREAVANVKPQDVWPDALRKRISQVEERKVEESMGGTDGDGACRPAARGLPRP